MNKTLLCPTLLLMCTVVIGCISLAYLPNREIAAIPVGTYETLSFNVKLPKRAHSWEIGLWPPSGNTNIGDFAGKYLVARVTNVSDRKLTLSPGVSSRFERVLVIEPGQNAIVCEAQMKSLGQLIRLFGSDTHQHGVSFHLNLEFRPPVQIKDRISVRARGRDAL